MCDQSLFHGEGAVAMTAGQTTRNHVMVRNEREGSSVYSLVFTAQMPNQNFASNGFKAQRTQIAWMPQGSVLLA